jgi:hypothetical protein
MADRKRRPLFVIIFEPGSNGTKTSGVRDGFSDRFNAVSDGGLRHGGEEGQVV